MMDSDSLDCVGSLLRTFRAARNASWWLRLSAHNAMLEGLAAEAARAAADSRAVTDPSNGALRQSLSRTRP